MIWIIICIIPFGLLIIESGMNLNWTFMASQVFIAPFIVPLYLTIGWARATSNALIAGVLLNRFKDYYFINIPNRFCVFYLDTPPLTYSSVLDNKSR